MWYKEERQVDSKALFGGYVVVPTVMKAGKIYLKKVYNYNIISENMSVRHGTNLADARG